jgi:hypothetical protein
MYFSTIQMLMNAAIDRRRQAEEGTSRAEQKIATLGLSEQKDPCRLANVYREFRQLKKARERYQECVQRGDDPHVPGLALFQLVFVDMDLGLFKEARAYLDRLRTVNPEYYRNARHLETMLPKEE